MDDDARSGFIRRLDLRKGTFKDGKLHIRQ